MKATVIVDNIGNERIFGEWGLCIHIEYKGKNILLDTGASSLFIRNAEQLNISLKDIDFAVLSHAHYDHGNGMSDFFEINDKATFYLQEGCKENCYAKKWVFRKYIGLPQGVLAAYKDRIVYATDNFEICDGVSLIPHRTPHLEEIGKREGMYQKSSTGWIPDNFCHEQSLVLDTAEGLVVFNCCSHGGVINIIREVSEAYPGKTVAALIGGFHLYNKSQKEVRQLAREIQKTGIQYIYTGHCTGKKAFGWLHEELGDMIKQLEIGLEISNI
ncbi:7,8-dihydropterin-6-yl-methyl-4-(beta-D-ribofuranosyl)aminobenzene 5'-phosphate synthase [Aequitasia blattaphilus]|uniref:MBL fold metallo-hydrolase n=1 Tax=Aequitasia blattaphilus TaxID=2949332 RepID=A0ABT1E4Z0_9FIRM|nr:MBL fold metallo-hydrolase [Aequitasia blattaphilus]MCP1100909.1 MBL fold metallo-hydrolase [Aequitasia blattaphilus]MCR8613549.1 MBL fold metallo-hydrolase [Aequitasia blattaphilus]